MSVCQDISQRVTRLVVDILVLALAVTLLGGAFTLARLLYSEARADDSIPFRLLWVVVGAAAYLGGSLLLRSQRLGRLFEVAGPVPLLLLLGFFLIRLADDWLFLTCLGFASALALHFATREEAWPRRAFSSAFASFVLFSVISVLLLGHHAVLGRLAAALGMSL